MQVNPSSAESTTGENTLNYVRQIAGAALIASVLLSSPLISCKSAPDEVNHHRIVEQLATELENAYLFPDISKRYAETLRSKSMNTYKGLEPEAFAKQLTDLLQSVHTDAHLRVEYYDSQFDDQDSSTPEQSTKPSPAIGAAQWLAPDISYLRANLFPSDQATLATLTQFMDEHIGSKTLIIDVRGHRGGGLAEMDILFEDLFAKETALLHMETRKSVDDAGGSPIKDGATVRRVVSKEDVVRRAHFAIPRANPRYLDTKIYILVSGYTASAAEHLAQAMKKTGRGVVIGETTRGGAHYGGTALLADGFGVFIPVGRTFDPDTNKDWEGIGVIPDYPVDARLALIAALIDAGTDPNEARRIDTALSFTPPSRP